jgi:uncharacterized protein (DUF433 family)
MRITVSHVLEMLAGEMTPGGILKDFFYLEKQTSVPLWKALHVT